MMLRGQPNPAQTRQFAACFRDYRDPKKIEHTVEELIAQRGTGSRWGTKI